jgi:hypothetical protein
VFIRSLTAAMFYCGTTLVFAQSYSAAPGSWRAYPFPDAGFVVSLPGPPEISSIPTKDGTITAYQLTEPVVGKIRYSVFVGHASRGVFEPEAMNAWLDGTIQGALSVAVDGKLIESDRSTFRGYPAKTFLYQHNIAGVPYVGRGVAFMIDGRDMRISMQYPIKDADGDEKYETLIDSFQLIPFAYTKSEASVTRRGVSFTPPRGWLESEPKSQFDIARFHDLTRSLVLLASESQGYSCSKYGADLQASSRLRSTAITQIADQSFTRFVVEVPVPKYNVTLRDTHYCLDSPARVVVLIGTVEESEAERWADVFLGVAATVRISSP